MPGGNQTQTVRQRVEAVSRPLLVRLTAMPRLLVPLVTVALIAVGVFAPLLVALVALALVVAFIGWIAYLAWPVVPIGGKIIRLVMLALVIALAVTRF